jgi:hypothetical protein
MTGATTAELKAMMGHTTAGHGRALSACQSDVALEARREHEHTCLTRFAGSQASAPEPRHESIPKTSPLNGHLYVELFTP